MSRIHEALQRAAEQATSSEVPVEGGSVPLPEEQDVQALAREGFPVEFVATRRPRHTEVPPVEEPADRQSRATEPPDPAPSKSLFERIDGVSREGGGRLTHVSGSREQYRRLAAVLHDAQGNNGFRVLMMCSAVPGEGKTLTATNLALTFSESYRRRVLLIDADLRRRPP